MNIHSQTLAKKETSVVRFLSRDNDVLRLLSQDATEAVAYRFPVAALIKSNRSARPDLHHYSLASAGFREWYG